MTVVETLQLFATVSATERLRLLFAASLKLGPATSPAGVMYFRLTLAALPFGFCTRIQA